MNIDYWIKNINLQEKKELLSLKKAELDDRFYTSLAFGTAGMRGVLGIGPNRMNVYQIRRVCLGYSKYLKEHFSNPSIAISYDNRRMSKEFAIIAANIFSSYKIKVFLTSELRPTPYLSYIVRNLKCSGGVMITASHNPKDNNGIKLYDETGCQYTPKAIKPIIDLINKSDYFEPCESSNELLINDAIGFDKAYVNDVLSIRLNRDLDLAKVNGVFSPLNGTTSTLIKAILPNLTFVDEQMVNDSEFSTLILPNPEDERVFELAKTYAKSDTDILLATDPDGDRLGCMVKSNDEFVYLTGNQISIVILDYILQNKHGLGPKDIVFKSIVTSNLGDLLCKKYQVTMRHVLTGFKYVGDGIKSLAPDERFLFGYEESNGCLIKPFVRDKDSLQAVLMLTEACAYYKEKNMTIIDRLEELYKQYGYFLNHTFSYVFTGIKGQTVMQKFIDYFRNNQIAEEQGKVDFMQQTTYDKTNMIMIKTNYGSLIARPSGTEPKVKVYAEINLANEKLAKQKLTKIKGEIDSIIKVIEND